MPDCSLSIDSGANRLGVPPPIKTERTLRPQIDGSASSRSFSSASTYTSCGTSPRASCELKSQYGQFLRPHGICTYSDSGCSVLQFGRLNGAARYANPTAASSML